MTTINISDVTYTYHTDTDIHEFTFHKSSRQAVDDWLAHMNVIYEDKTRNDHLHFLIDARESGSLPLSYMFTAATKWVQQLRVHPHVRLALVNKPGENILTALSDKIVKTMRLGHLEMTNFYGDSKDQAITWLLKQ